MKKAYEKKATKDQSANKYEKKVKKAGHIQSHHD